MSIDKRRLYLFVYSLLAFLILCLFIPVNLLKYILAVGLVLYAFLVCFFVKKRSILSLYKKNVLYLIIVISLVYLTIYYLSGIKFGYLQSHKFSFSIIFKYILPFSAIIISSELIRHVFLAQNKKCVDLIAYISSILIDYLMVYNVFSFNNFNMFIDIMSLTLLPSIMFNILYHNLSKEYGLWPGISFRLVLTLYPFIIPIIPNTPESLVSLFNLFVPLLILWFIKSLYNKEFKPATYRMSKLNYISFSILILCMFCFILLITNKFKYGVVVVATPSMEDEINIGDVVLFEKIDYDDVVLEGQVIVFHKNDLLIVHRVDSIEYTNGVIRYYTKGDNNENIDDGFITHENIVGYVNARIPYFGYPTLWLRELFD